MGIMKTTTQKKSMNNKLETPKKGKYIYGIIRHTGSIDFGHIGMGNPAEKVYGINFQDISAIVSNSPVIQYEARRVNLITHEKVLEEIMKQFTVLPVRFSTISQDEGNAIDIILKKDYHKFSELLNEMEDKKELGIKVLIQENTMLENILEKYDEIRNLKEKLLKLPADKTHYQRIKIGKMIAEALQHETEHYKNEILEVLSPLAEEVKINDSFSEQMLLNAAFLIKKSAESKFDKAVDELDEKNGHLLRYKYVGTLPPYNFVNLVISTKSIEDVLNR